MKFKVTYTRMLTLEEELEASDITDAERLANIRYGSLDTWDFEMEGDFEIEPIESETGTDEPECPQGYFWNGRQCLRSAPWPALSLSEREGF